MPSTGAVRESALSRSMQTAYGKRTRSRAFQGERACAGKPDTAPEEPTPGLRASVARSPGVCRPLAVPVVAKSGPVAAGTGWNDQFIPGTLPILRRVSIFPSPGVIWSVGCARPPASRGGPRSRRGSRTRTRGSPVFGRAVCCRRVGRGTKRVRTRPQATIGGQKGLPDVCGCQAGRTRTPDNTALASHTQNTQLTPAPPPRRRDPKRPPARPDRHTSPKFRRRSHLSRRRGN